MELQELPPEAHHVARGGVLRGALRRALRGGGAGPGLLRTAGRRPPRKRRGQPDGESLPALPLHRGGPAQEGLHQVRDWFGWACQLGLHLLRQGRRKLATVPGQELPLGLGPRAAGAERTRRLLLHRRHLHPHLLEEHARHLLLLLRLLLLLLALRSLRVLLLALSIPRLRLRGLFAALCLCRGLTLLLDGLRRGLALPLGSLLLGLALLPGGLLSRLALPFGALPRSS